MPTITFLRPIDQPTGQVRLLEELRTCLRAADYEHLRFAVAFAKQGPLLRLAADIEAWRATSKTVEAVFGIDHMGTSKQALEFALRSFDSVYVTHVGQGNPQRVTFHPKMYIFDGDQKAVCFYGSHNLTVGGTETNFEAGVKIEFDLPLDAGGLRSALDCWESLLPAQCVSTRLLDAQLLDELARGGYLLDEATQRVRQPRPAPVAGGVMPPAIQGQTGQPLLFPPFRAKPPSPIPRALMPAVVRTPARTPAPNRTRRVAPPSVQPALRSTSNSSAAQALVLEITPKHNGEVFLSKIAVNQNPGFFGFPFTGLSQPKLASNQPYPQLEPDPIVDITLYDNTGSPLRQLSWAMNTVYYELKGEIRVTFPPDLLRLVPDYSVMVMEKGTPPVDYNISIFIPGSQQHSDYVAVCNQTMPSGGAAQARRLGWL